MPSPSSSETNLALVQTVELQMPQETSSSSSHSVPKETQPEGEADQTSRSDSEQPQDKDEHKAQSVDQKTPSSHSPSEPNPWQAIWSPQHNAYYFYNAQTQETTWTNPLQPEASTSKGKDKEEEPEEPEEPPASSEPIAAGSQSALYAAAIAQGIDPSLAHLDPTLAALSGSSSSLSFTAKFNARTGAFARPDSRDPTHLSEYERAKRMSEFYFDVNAWQQDLAKREEAEAEEGKKRKRPTKSDLERFKDQKKQKKLAKTAWLRS